MTITKIADDSGYKTQLTFWKTRTAVIKVVTMLYIIILMSMLRKKNRLFGEHHKVIPKTSTGLQMASSNHRRGLPELFFTHHRVEKLLSYPKSNRNNDIKFLVDDSKTW